MAGCVGADPCVRPPVYSEHVGHVGQVRHVRHVRQTYPSIRADGGTSSFPNTPWPLPINHYPLTIFHYTPFVFMRENVYNYHN